uniref:BHLH domain-containing protein n=1 Tax=Aegilops tauschii subsp. strangulata TaxID=200361 RepID=A0A453IL56_AEGTS
PGMEQQFAEPPLPGHQEQYYTTSPMATPSFHPSRSSDLPSFGGSSSLPNLPFGLATVKNELGQPSPPPPSSNFLSFGAGQAGTLNFSGGAWQHDGVEGTMQLQAPERRSRAPANAQEHVIAERKRREKLQQQFVSLATIVPGLKKVRDKTTWLHSCGDQLPVASLISYPSPLFSDRQDLSAGEHHRLREAAGGQGEGPGEARLAEVVGVHHRLREQVPHIRRRQRRSRTQRVRGRGRGLEPGRRGYHPGEHGAPENLLQGEERGAGDGPLRAREPGPLHHKHQRRPVHRLLPQHHHHGQDRRGLFVSG